MVVNDTAKVFTYWRRVLRLCVQIRGGVKTGETVRPDEHMLCILDINISRWWL